MALIIAALLVTVGTPLFLGEWIFGSIGWGLLHGLLLLVGIATFAGLAAVGISSARLGRSVVIAAIIGVVVGVVLGLDLTNRAWSVVGDALVPLATPDSRPLLAALICLPIAAGALIALLMLIRALGPADSPGDLRPDAGTRAGMALPAAAYIGWLAGLAYAYTTATVMPDWRILVAAVVGAVIAEVILIVIGAWRPGAALVTGLSVGAVLGIGLAFLTALALGPRVGAAVGLTVGLIAWPGLMAADFAGTGVDVEALKERFIPRRTIEMTKETIEWARARMPLSRRS